MLSGKELKLSYVDIGAWRPINGSNTYAFYRAGNYGTVVEPNPHFRKLWSAVRPRDTFLQVGCGTGTFGELKIFSEGAASNTFSSNFANEIKTSQGYFVTRVEMVPMMTLDQIIDIHRQKHNGPFLLDIDVEGLDYEVLQTLDFLGTKRPFAVLIEDTNALNATPDRVKISQLLNSHGYVEIARTVVTALYVDGNIEFLSGAKIEG